MNSLLEQFIYDFDVIEEVWLGLVCNPGSDYVYHSSKNFDKENETWVWHDGQPLDYNALEDGSGTLSNDSFSKWNL